MFSLLVLLSHLRRVLPACLFAFGLLWGSSAFAQYAPHRFITGNPQLIYEGPTEQAACDAWAIALGNGATGTLQSQDKRVCLVYRGANLVGVSYMYRSCQSTGTGVSYSEVGGGTPCSTPPPPPPVDCSDPEFMNVFVGTNTSAIGSGEDIPDKVCVGQCQYTTGGIGVGVNGSFSVILSKGTGQQCSPTDKVITQTEVVTKDTPPTQASCGQKGQVLKSVNGVDVCAPAGTGAGESIVWFEFGEGELPAPPGTPANANNSPATTVQTTSNVTNTYENNIVNTITTTTTVTNYLDGTKKSETKTETKSQDGDSFCKSNPNDRLCKAGGVGGGGGGSTSGSFSGSCGGFSCTGDAVQCAIALEQHRRNCEAEADHPFKTAFEEASEVGNGFADIVDATGGLTTVNVADGFNVSSRYGNGVCPAPYPYVVMGQSYTFSFQPMCDMAPIVKFIVICASCMFALRILVKG